MAKKKVTEIPPENVDLETGEIVDADAEQKEVDELNAKAEAAEKHRQEELEAERKAAIIRDKLRASGVTAKLTEIKAGKDVQIKLETDHPEELARFMELLNDRVVINMFPAQGRLPFNDQPEEKEQPAADQQDLPLATTTDGPMPPKPDTLQ